MKRKNIAKIGLCGLLSGYFALTAPAIPYVIDDIVSKQGTEQMSNIPRRIAAVEALKTMYRGLVWYPYQKTRAFFSDREEYTIIVNKETQRLYVFDNEGKLRLQSSTSTGKQKKDKRVFLNERITPVGEYMAVKPFDKEEIRSWFGEEKAPLYGEGMILFLGKWFPHIAIHGTNHEELLGHEASLGCPRVDKKTIEWILENVAVGSKMLVQPYGIVPHVFQTDDHLKRPFSKYLNPHLEKKELPSISDIVFIEKSDYLGKGDSS